MAFTYHIKVTGSNAEVIREPHFKRLKKNRDEVKFQSNDARTVIRYRATSAFAEAELGPEHDF